jgi:hypothetical protein
MKRLIGFFVLMRALWLLSGALARTDGIAKAISLEQRLNELVGNYTNYCAGLQQMPHLNPATATVSDVVNSLITNKFMHT